MFKALGNKPSKFSLPSAPWINNSASPDDVENLISDTGSSSSKNWPNFNYFRSLRIGQQANENDNQPTKIERCLSCFPSLGYHQRLIGFGVSMSLGIFFFFMSAMNLPVLILRSRKFSLLFTMGSISTMSSIGFITGPTNFLTKLLSKNHLVFSLVYSCTLIATLYFALHLQSTMLTVPCAFFQVLALIWLVFSFIPGGQRGLQFITSMLSSTFKKSVSQTLPV